MNIKQIIDDHWEYIEKTLRIHHVKESEIEIAKYHYKTAFLHGFKHKEVKEDK